MAHENELETGSGSVSEPDSTPETAARSVAEDQEELKLCELLILASLWMLFGFMLWFYLSAFHGAPVRLASDAILGQILGSHFHQIIVDPNSIHREARIRSSLSFNSSWSSTTLLAAVSGVESGSISDPDPVSSSFSFAMLLSRPAAGVKKHAVPG